MTGFPTTDDSSVTASPVTLEGQVLRGVTAIAAGYNYTVTLIGGVSLLPYLNARIRGNQLSLAWPTNAVGLTLQSTLNLTPPIIWIDSTQSPATIGIYLTVTNAASGHAQFYRLNQP